MAKLMSKKTKEIVKTTVVLVALALIIGFYIIYPLIVVNRMTARPDKDKFKDPAFILPNDASFFTLRGLAPDTFTVESNDNIKLAALYFSSDTMRIPPRGTVILIHGDDTNRTALADFIAPILDSNLAVVLYDQRAAGFSGGKYYYAGSYEADDLQELIASLNLHGRLHLPLLTVGFGLGGDAAIIAARAEKRISAVLAVDPYLTSTEWIVSRKEKMGTLTLPFYKTIYFWWYQKISGYPYDRTTVSNITAVGCETVILLNNNNISGNEINRLKAASQSEMLTVIPQPSDNKELNELILRSIYSLAH